MRTAIAVALGAVAAICGGILAKVMLDRANTVTREWTEYQPPQQTLQLEDEQLADHQPSFDESLVDSRPLQDWELNLSAAVIELDCPLIKPDRESELLQLHPSYRDAMQASERLGRVMLPSANLLDGAGKQLDDGMYCAMDLWQMHGDAQRPGAVRLVADLFDVLPEQSPARAFLAAALQLADQPAPASPHQQAQLLVDDFLANAALSKPLGAYNWSPELQQAWRFFRFLQQKHLADSALARDLAASLAENPQLRDRYERLTAFYSQLTNPLACGTLTVEGSDYVAFLPYSTSRETELFNQLFPNGLPAGANLMNALILAVRSGAVDLTPQPGDGWYQYQVHALESLLLPQQTQESHKLLLKASYQKRLLDAFKALMTKRRETHIRQNVKSAGSAAPVAGEVQPRLRIEPCPTFYLRTARAYGFVGNLLQAEVGDVLSTLHGKSPEGDRPRTLQDELQTMRQRFYGFYLMSCEDIGLRPDFLDEEPVDVEASLAAAEQWLGQLTDDVDLARDTRVVVPIYTDGVINRNWATIGVRLAPLTAGYARPPHYRESGGEGDWQQLDPWQCSASQYVLAVDEFAEFERPAGQPLTRAEFRELDRHATKEALLEALR